MKDFRFHRKFLFLFVNKQIEQKTEVRTFDRSRSCTMLDGNHIKQDAESVKNCLPLF